MKKSYLRLLSVSIILLALAGCQTGQDLQITLSNPTSMLRVDEPVTIQREALEKAWGKTTGENTVPLLISSTGDTIPSQADDLTGDGRWDELFFVYNLAPDAEVQLSVSFVNASMAPQFTPRSHIQLAAMTEAGNYEPVTRARRIGAGEGLAAGIYQMEGPGWENDLVGFRNYLDVRNGMDIFGKTTPDMILHEAGIVGDYHEMLHWGMDILRVGSSLGAGSLALHKNDALHRVAPNADGYAEVITNGPLRSILRLQFNDWDVDEVKYNVQHDIIIHAGTWFYESKVKIDGPANDSHLVAGITTIDLGHQTPTVANHANGITSISTHGNQAYDFEKLGMAIMLDSAHFSNVSSIGPEGEDINNSILVKMPFQADLPVSFRFYSVWEVSDERFADEEQFNLLLESEAFKMANPVVVDIQ